MADMIRVHNPNDYPVGIKVNNGQVSRKLSARTSLPITLEDLQGLLNTKLFDRGHLVIEDIENVDEYYVDVMELERYLLLSDEEIIDSLSYDMDDFVEFVHMWVDTPAIRRRFLQTIIKNKSKLSLEKAQFIEKTFKTDISVLSEFIQEEAVKEAKKPKRKPRKKTTSKKTTSKKTTAKKEEVEEETKDE